MAWPSRQGPAGPGWAWPAWSGVVCFGGAIKARRVRAGLGWTGQVRPGLSWQGGQLRRDESRPDRRGLACRDWAWPAVLVRLGVAWQGRHGVVGQGWVRRCRRGQIGLGPVCRGRLGTARHGLARPGRPGQLGHAMSDARAEKMRMSPQYGTAWRGGPEAAVEARHVQSRPGRPGVAWPGHACLGLAGRAWPGQACLGLAG